MHYSEYIPIAPLQRIVKTIWVLEDVSSTGSDYEKIFPDCCAEMIFHGSDPMWQRENNESVKQERHFVYGQISKFIELRSVKKVFVIGVKFYPWGLSSLSDIPQYEMQQYRVAIPDIFKNADACIQEKIDCTKPVEQKIGLIQQFLLKILLARKNRFSNDSLEYAVSQIQQSDGLQKIASISDRLNISTRELERRFKKYIGISPKQMSRIYRFQSALQLKDTASSLTDIAHAAGYYDQSHFIREFKDIAGINPNIFFNKEQKLTEAFINYAE